MPNCPHGMRQRRVGKMSRTYIAASLRRCGIAMCTSTMEVIMRMQYTKVFKNCWKIEGMSHWNLANVMKT